MYFLVNNATLIVRGPMLVALVTVLSMNYLVANIVSLLALALLRYGLSDLWIWGRGKTAAAHLLHSYDIHGLVTVASDVRLPELERFRVESLRDRPTIRVRIGRLSRAQSELVSALAFFARHTRYDEKLGRMGFGIEIGIGRSVEVVASPSSATRRTCSTRTSSSRSCAGRSSRRATRSCTRRASRSTAGRT